MKIFFTIFCILLSHFLLAQRILLFQKTYQNFGQINSGMDQIDYTFVFKNVSDQNVKIENIEADCACGSSFFNENPILPQQTDSIKVSFLPYRVGAFEKKFVVYTNDKQTYTLTLEGFILPHSSELRTVSFKYRNGNLSFKHKNLNMGTLEPNVPITKQFSVYNPTNKAVVFTDQMIVPPHIKIFFDTSHIIPPKEISSIIVTYDPTKRTEFGYLQDNVVMFTTDTIDARMSMNLVAFIKDDSQKDQYFYQVSEEKMEENASKANFPFLQISEKEQHLGIIYPNMNVITEFEIYNEGAMPLKISHIEGNENCQIISDLTQEIEPEETIVIQVRFLPKQIAGEQSTQFSIFSNDPQQNKVTAEIKAEILMVEE